MTKKEFEVFMGKFNDVNNLFRELTQGTSFYTKLNDILARMDNEFEGFVNARRIEAQEIEQMLGGGRGGGGGGGGGGGPNLPNMYPNQQPQQGLGFYVPPPMNFDQAPKNNPYQNNSSSMGDMLHNLLSSKPNFDANIFGGNDKIYQSRYK